MAGGRGAGGCCQDRGKAQVGKEGEKLSNITLQTWLSDEENQCVCTCVCVGVGVSVHACVCWGDVCAHLSEEAVS